MVLDCRIDLLAAAIHGLLYNTLEMMEVLFTVFRLTFAAHYSTAFTRFHIFALPLNCAQAMPIMNPL